jgi:4-aminobutyrate aminotransferase/(S)-3-amino-2-methylpropionate transaminase
LSALQAIFKNDVPPDRVAAIIIEPVQGEGGFNPAPRELMIKLRELCDQNGILLIADEIQSGFARTGKLFAMENFNVQVDLITMAKSLAGGLPLSGVTGTASIMDAPMPGALGGTYGGPPLSCAAALAVLNVIEKEKLCERAMTLGDRVRSRLESFAANKSLTPIGNIRGFGSMLGFDIVESHGSSQPVIEGAKKVTARAHELGLILLGCGTQSEAIRLLYPLTASESLVDEGMSLLEQALKS